MSGEKSKKLETSLNSFCYCELS